MTVATIEPSRVKQFDNVNIDMEQFLAENVEVLQKPGKPVKVGSVAEAGERAGYTVAVPAVLPEDAKLEATVPPGDDAAAQAFFEEVFPNFPQELKEAFLREALTSALERAASEA